ncbi:hypothetical protein [Phenylobacterium sp.]|jgi:hypothetical protein|uniref:hypothetical protein n=1 Tax=Phenylobacterium sp. TaxID=1871053 RepID=UPI002E2FF754|nr:hypothetical protein [Phenylobacterium sp.]HEX2559922.1 hypothetical protein [Phenylobacterium sp.]
MRTLALAAAAALSLAPAAFASPLPSVSSVSVAIGPELQEKAEKTYGVRDVQRLADELQREAEQALARSGALGGGGRLELVLVDAKPNRPTFKQLGDTPGLSFQSFGVGGATIEGRAISADGAVTPISYRWYETDIRQAAYGSTWSDAEWTIERFAGRLGRGQALAQR